MSCVKFPPPQISVGHIHLFFQECGVGECSVLCYFWCKVINFIVCRVLKVSKKIEEKPEVLTHVIYTPTRQLEWPVLIIPGLIFHTHS